MIPKMTKFAIISKVDKDRNEVSHFEFDDFIRE
jgi:hypothetical protein